VHTLPVATLCSQRCCAPNQARTGAERRKSKRQSYNHWTTCERRPLSNRKQLLCSSLRTLAPPSNLHCAVCSSMSLTAAGKSFQEDAKGFTQTREHSHTVIVIGAGVAGLLSALHFSMKPGLGFHATIIADEPPPDEKSSSTVPPAFEPLDISDAVMRYLDFVKLRSSVAPSFCHPDAKAVRSWDGRLLQWIEHPHPIADTQEFRRILIKVAAERGVDFMWNTRVIELADVGWGVVCLLSDRTQTAADLLVGCDGPRSMVRTTIEGGLDSRFTCDPSGVLAFSAEFRDSTRALLSLVDQTQHFYGPLMSAHVYPFKDGLYKFQIYVSSSIDAKTSDNPADLKGGPLLPAYRNLMVLARANSPTPHLIRLLQTGTACPNLCRHIGNVRPPLTRLATGRMVVLGSASMAHDCPCFRPSMLLLLSTASVLSNNLQCCRTLCFSCRCWVP
jgi:2-polyprenyl-6-methoxyphenol hydroxylase-like FAD-dependent oxidoreductase